MTCFHLTATMATVHVYVSCGCSGTHSKPGPSLSTNQQYVNPTMLLDPWHHVTQCSIVAEQSNNLL
jgi:hypothetical protein